MKKLLSLMMLMLLCTSAWAEPVTDEITPTVLDLKTGNSYVDWYNKTFTSDAVYAGNSFPSRDYIQLRSKNSNSGIVTTTSGGKVKIIDITFVSPTANGANIDIYGKDTPYQTVSELYDSSTQGDLLGTITSGSNTTLYVSGDYRYIGIRSRSGAVYLSNISITWEKVTPPAVETPVITFDPAAPYQGDVVTCSITCATNGAAIQYSTDGENYSDYPADGFTLTENTTVYAKATRGADVSEVAQKSITFTPITTVANIAALNQLADGTVFRMTGSATVVYTDASKHIYIKDDTGYTLLYNSHDAADKGYTVSNIVGTVSIYKGLFEAKETDFDVEVGDTQVDPTVMTIPNIAATNMNQYVKLENVSITAPVNQNFTITDADKNTLQGRDNFSLGEDFPNDVTDKKFDIEGFVGIYNGTIQFYPTKFTENVSEDFEVSITPDGGDYTAPVTVTIETVNGVGDVLILYTLDGTNPYESNTAITYEAPFTLTSSCTVKAYAYYEVENVTTEARAEKTYTIELPDFSIEPSVATGTTLYKATDVTFTPKNGFGDLTISYKVNDSEEEITDAAFTVNVAENTTVTIEAVDGAGRKFNGEFTYKVDLFVPATKFKLVTDLNELEAGKQVLIAGFVEGDVNMYVMGAQNNNNRAAVKYLLGNGEEAPLASLDMTNTAGYKSMVLGKDGTNYTFYDVENEGYLYAAGANSSNHLKVQGTLNDNGKAAITLVDGIFSVVFQGNSSRNHMRFNPSDDLFSCYAETNSQEPVYLYVEGEVVEKTATPEIVVTEGEEAYTVTATGAGTVKLYKDGEEVGNPCTVARTSEEQTFVFTATAQEEGKDISEVATQNVTVPALPATTYTITLDKEPGDYTALVNVKATVEPALPEGATLTFKINDAEPKAYNPEKGVNMLESGTLTFTATDAAGNVLATKSAEYKYIMRVFGDLNNDGVVDVTEVGIIVNLILGKLNN